ncbi:hypothetical protein BC936DRAFT_142480, partial [Jimgerdemannia flammicorona]
MNSFAWFCAFLLMAASMADAITCPKGQYPTTVVAKIYTQPKTSGSPIGTIPKNTCVPIACQSPGQAASDGNVWWDNVTYIGVTGYASDSMFNTGPSNPTPAIPRCCYKLINVEISVNVYKGPGKPPITGTYPRGACVDLLCQTKGITFKG